MVDDIVFYGVYIDEGNPTRTFIQSGQDYDEQMKYAQGLQKQVKGVVYLHKVIYRHLLTTPICVNQPLQIPEDK